MLRDVRYSDRILCLPKDSKFKELHYDICQSINLTNLSCVLSSMLEEGMPKEMYSIFKQQAEGLLAAIISENNRIHNY